MTKKLGALALLMATLDVQATDAAQLLAELVWEKRVLMIFAPDPQATLLQRQDAALATARAEMIERDMAIIRVFADGRLYIDDLRRDDSSASFYQHFSTDRDQFRVVLIGKDGTLKLDQDSVVATAELFALIDAMPMRRYEMMQND